MSARPLQLERVIAAAAAARATRALRAWQRAATALAHRAALEQKVAATEVEYAAALLQSQSELSGARLAQLRHLLASLERGQEHAALRHAVGRWAAARRRELWAHGKMASPK